MTRCQQLAVQLGIVACVLAAWEASSRFGLVDARLLPPVSVVARHMYDLLLHSDLGADLLVTIGEVLLAFAIACPFGLAVGIILAESEYLGEVFKPFFYFGASIPKSIFLPIFMLMFGIGFAEKTVFGFFQAIFPLVIATIAAVHAVPRELMRVARAYGASRLQTYVNIQWPAMLPLVIEGVRLAILFDIVGVVFAEMTAGNKGLGTRIFVWGQQFQMADLIAGVLLAAFLGIFFNETVRAYEKRLSRWRP